MGKRREKQSHRHRNIPHDWSAYQYLSFWVYSAEANKTSVMLVAHSENEPTQQNYFKL